MATVQESQNEKTEEIRQKDIDNKESSKSVEPTITPQVEEYAPLKGFLDVKEANTEEKEQLRAIWDYMSNSTENKSIPSILYGVQKLENRLSAPKVGETRLQKIYRFVKLQRQVDDITKLKDSMMRPTL